MDQEPTRRTTRLAFREGVLVYLLGHAALSALLLWAVHKFNAQAVKTNVWALICFGPVAVTLCLADMRACTRGLSQRDAEVYISIRATVAAAVMGLLWWLVR